MDNEKGQEDTDRDQLDRLSSYDRQTGCISEALVAILQNRRLVADLGQDHATIGAIEAMTSE